MSLTVTGKARLVTDPKRGRTGGGRPWANAVLRVVNYRKTDAGWEEHSSFSCTAVAFEDTAFKLAGFVKGDEVEFTGRVRELKVWTPERGEPRAQLGLSLDEVTAPVKRPRGGNRADQSVAPSQRQPPAESADPWPRPAQPGTVEQHQSPAGAARRDSGAVVTNLRDHADRRARGQTRTGAGRPA